MSRGTIGIDEALIHIYRVLAQSESRIADAIQWAQAVSGDGQQPVVLAGVYWLFSQEREAK